VVRVRPIESIGRYGGTIQRALTGDVIQKTGITKTLSENLMGYQRPLPDSIELNLAEGYEFADGGKTIVFRIRKGVRWSDGVPFTVDDILFWYQDLALDVEASASAAPPGRWIVSGVPAGMEKIDDHTLKITARKPFARVLYALADDTIAYPKHVFAPLHPRYNPDTTYAEFRSRVTDATQTMEPGVPRISAWAPVEWVRGRRIVYERNPYYWKVDTAGNQLPYADRLTFSVIQDPQIILLKFANGELDLIGRYTRNDMLPTLRNEEKKGRFKLHLNGPEGGRAFYLNWDAPNPNLRRAFRDRRVRLALSYAINREEVNQILYHGYLKPGGYSFSPKSEYFSEEAYLRHSLFDPTYSRKLMDEAGYLDSDGDGYREFGDGSRFEMTIDVRSDQTNDSELVAEYWEAIGIKVHIYAILRDILFPRKKNGQFEIHFWTLGGADAPLSRPYNWGIIRPYDPSWHRLAFKDPPSWLAEATECLKQAASEYDPDKRRRLMARVRDLHTDNVPVISLGATYNLWAASNRLGNVPDAGTHSDAFRGWGRPVFHEQIYIRGSTAD
jgi:peptide/nickel transport system substrate-binding protein